MKVQLDTWTRHQCTRGIVGTRLQESCSWVVLRYMFWRSFTTGKSPTQGGVPHDTYGMTTRSVMGYILSLLRWYRFVRMWRVFRLLLHIYDLSLVAGAVETWSKPMYQDDDWWPRYNTCCLMAHWLVDSDGDLGSNEILMSKEKIVGIVDGSGVLCDPEVSTTTIYISNWSLIHRESIGRLWSIWPHKDWWLKTSKVCELTICDQGFLSDVR